MLLLPFWHVKTFYQENEEDGSSPSTRGISQLILLRRGLTPKEGN